MTEKKILQRLAEAEFGVYGAGHASRHFVAEGIRFYITFDGECAVVNSLYIDGKLRKLTVPIGRAILRLPCVNHQLRGRSFAQIGILLPIPHETARP